MVDVSVAVLRSAGRRPERRSTATREFRRGEVSQRGMGLLVVVFVTVLFAKHFGYRQACEELDVQELIPEARVEALAVGVLQRAAGFDEAGFETFFSNPVPDGLCHELRTVVRPDELGYSPPRYKFF